MLFVPTTVESASPRECSRRAWLKSATAMGLSTGVVPVVASLASSIRSAQAGTPVASDVGAPLKPIRSCILIFHYGGPSHFETYDPKPLAPVQVRGEWNSIETATPGIRVGENLPRVAKLSNRLAIVRSMHHPMRNHNSAAAETLSGRTPLSGDLELLADESRSFPTLGSIVNFGLGDRAHLLPYVALPHVMHNVVQLPGQTPGILGGEYERFQVEGNLVADDFKATALERRVEGADGQIAARGALLARLQELHDPQGAASGAADPTGRMSLFQRRALDLIASDDVRRGFDIGREAPELRDRYGRNQLGQSLLMARRLVESGVNFVAAFDGMYNGQDANWDSHTAIFTRHKQLIPPADQAFSALLEDLEARGLLDSTLVVVMAEFGRTPKVNASAGRDHWPDCYSIVLSGGGTRGGVIHGASDKIGAFPDRDPVSPADLVATILWRFGIDHQREIHDLADRPWRLADGKPLSSLFGAS